MPRPPVKKTRVLAKAQREGELKAQTEHDYKSVKFLADMIPFMPEKYKKNAVLWMKKIFEKHLAKIPKAIAIVGMTYIIKRLIDTTEDLRAKVNTLEKVTKIPSEFLLTAFPISGLMIPFMPTEVREEGLFPDWMDWIIAFSLAYIIVEHAGQLALGIGEGIKSITGMIGFLLGVPKIG